jgi:hypothetical protein
VIRRRIMILNAESHRQRFTVYPDAARITHGFFIGDAGHKRSELTTWVHVRKRVIRLGAHRSVLDLVTIRVPKVATRGEHYGVVWVQQSSRRRNAKGFFIRQIARVGIRIYLAVGRGGAPPTRFAITSLRGSRSRHGFPVLTARVRDTGRRAIDLEGMAWLRHGPGGISAGPFRSRQTLTLAPGQSGAVRFIGGKRLPDGPWRATVKLTSGLTTRRASATIVFSNHHAWLSPAAMIWTGGGLMIALFLVLAGLLRRGRQRRTHARPLPLFRTREG